MPQLMAHALTHSLSLTPTHPLTHSHSLTHSLTQSLTHSVTHSLTHSVTHTQSLTLTQSLTQSLSHSLCTPPTHARTLTPCLVAQLGTILSIVGLSTQVLQQWHSAIHPVPRCHVCYSFTLPPSLPPSLPLSVPPSPIKSHMPLIPVVWFVRSFTATASAQRTLHYAAHVHEKRGRILGQRH